MPEPDVASLLTEVELNPPASPAMIAEAEAALGVALPDCYRAFLSLADGGDGDVGASVAQLWRVGELKLMNDGYEAARCAPGLLIIGGNGGGEAYCIDRRGERPRYVMAPLLTLADEDMFVLGEDFGAFLKTLYEGRLFDTPA